MAILPSLRGCPSEDIVWETWTWVHLRQIDCSIFFSLKANLAGRCWHKILKKPRFFSHLPYPPARPDQEETSSTDSLPPPASELVVQLPQTFCLAESASNSRPQTDTHSSDGDKSFRGPREFKPRELKDLFYPPPPQSRRCLPVTPD